MNYMIKTSKILLAWMFVLYLYSCNTYRIQSYVYDRGLYYKKVNGMMKPYTKSDIAKSIVLISDTTLNYNIRYGGIGASTTIKYKIENQLLIIDTVDIYGRNSFQSYTDEVFGNIYSYSEGSLVNKKNGDKYNVKK